MEDPRCLQVWLKQERKQQSLRIHHRRYIRCFKQDSFLCSYGNRTTSNGVAIAVAQHTTKLPISVKISGGRFSGYSALYESNPKNNSDPAISLEVTGGEFSCINGGTVAVYSVDCTAFIKGGSYSSEPAAAYIAEGYGAVESEGIYKVLPSNAE